MSCIAMYLYCLPTPNAIHNLLIWKRRKLAIASTTTSVSTVRRIMLSIPCRAQSDACKMSLVSASSCVQGDISGVTSTEDDNTTVSLVERIHLFDSHGNMVVCSARYRNSSVLFESTLRNSPQLAGSLTSASTLRRTPLPRLSRVWAFKLFGMYLSQIISTRCTLCNWLLIYGKLNLIFMVKKCFTCSRWFQYIYQGSTIDKHRLYSRSDRCVFCQVLQTLQQVGRYSLSQITIFRNRGRICLVFVSKEFI